MTTWISKSFGLLAAVLLTSGCEIPEGDGGLNLFAGSLGGAAKPKPLSQADLAKGSVMLVPAAGYCSDPTSLDASFALVARCDTLGGSGTDLAAPLVIITVAVTPWDDDAKADARLLGASENQLSRVGTFDDIVIGRVADDAPSSGLSDEHWRSVGRVGNNAVGLSLFGSEAGLPNQVLAARILTSTIRRTREASPVLLAASE